MKQDQKSVQYESRSCEFYPEVPNDKLPGSSFRLDLLSLVPSPHATDSVGATFLRRTSGATVSVMTDYLRSVGYWSTATPIHSDLSGVMQLSNQ
jgi:hypothetical protein